MGLDDRLAHTAFFVTGNYLEATLWGAIALGFVVVAMRPSSKARAKLLLAALAFATFGVSDVVEVQTGAWWRPWWLLVWKGVCVLALASLYIDYVRTRRGRARSG